MTATTTPSATALMTMAAPTPAVPAMPGVLPVGSRRPVWKIGAVAGLSASVATFGYAALARALDVPLEVGGQSIPLIGFAQLTLVASIVGTVLAVTLSRRAGRPRRVFLTTTIGLTFVSVVPDVVVDAHTATKLVLALSHLVAAAIVIPALASRLSD
jgi:Family of unknown function (DUF6069)